MTDTTLTPVEAEQFRHRVEYEDQLLNDRTTVVLELNGLAAVAVSLSLPTEAKSITVGVILVVNALWLLCAVDAAWFIRQLTDRLRAAKQVPADELLRWQVQEGRIRIGTTRFMTFVVPILLTAGWIAGTIIVLSGASLVPAIPARPWFFTTGTLLAFLGAAVLAWGLMMSKQEAIDLGSFYGSLGTGADKLTLPPIRDRLRQSRNARWGLALMFVGAVLQMIGAGAA